MKKTDEQVTPLLLTSDDVAQLLSVTRSKVRDLEQNDELPAVRIGRLVRFRRSDVEDFVRAIGQGGITL